MASLNLVAPRFSTLGIIEGMQYLQEEKNKEAERQLRIVQAQSEIARQRKLSLEANILQQTGLETAQSRIDLIKQQATTSAAQASLSGARTTLVTNQAGEVAATEAAQRKVLTERAFANRQQGYASGATAKLRTNQAGEVAATEAAQRKVLTERAFANRQQGYASGATAKLRTNQAGEVAATEAAQRKVLAARTASLNASASASSASAGKYKASAYKDVSAKACADSGDANSPECRQHFIAYPRKSSTKTNRGGFWTSTSLDGSDKLFGGTTSTTTTKFRPGTSVLPASAIAPDPAPRPDIGSAYYILPRYK